MTRIEALRAALADPPGGTELGLLLAVSSYDSKVGPYVEAAVNAVPALLAEHDAARAYRVWRDGSGQDQKGGWELWQALCDAIAAAEEP